MDWKDTVMSEDEAMKYYVTDSELATGIRCAKAQAERTWDIAYKQGRDDALKPKGGW